MANAQNAKNRNISISGSKKIGNMSFEPKNIDISVKNMSKPSKMIIWPSLHINSKSTEINGLIRHFWI